MWFKLLLLFFVFSFIFKTDHSFDQDLGRHLKLGEIIWQTKTIPATNLFSYTNPNFPFINTHWLFEVFAYLVNITAGLQFLLILKIIILLFSVWLILKIIPKENQVLLLPLGFIFLHVLRERTELRPEIFSFLFTAGTLYILEGFLVRAKSRTYLNALYLLPFIQLFWINIHIYFFVGLVLQAIFLLNLIYLKLRSHLTSGKLKLLIIIFTLSIAVSIFNPHGLTGLLYPLNVTKNYGYTIVENQTMFLLESINFKDPNFLFVKLSIGIILLSILIVILNVVKNLKIKSEDPSLITQDDKFKNILLAGFGAVLALMNVRSFPYLVFLSLPAVLENFGAIRSTFWTKLFISVTIPLLFYESIVYLNTKPQLEFKESGKGALDFVISNNLPDPIYNNFDIGSYIIYRGYPKYRVFVDGRPEAFPKEFFSQIYIPTQADYSKFKDLETKWGFKTIIFSVTDQTPWGRAFLTSVAADKDWQAVYLDNFMVVLVKNRIL